MTEKGYIEPQGSDGNTPAQQLRALLGGLCKTDDDQQILTKLCEKVTAFDDKTITFSDRGDETAANYARGGAVVYNDAVPRSFSEIARSVSELFWDGGGPEVGFSLDDSGASQADTWLFDEIAEEEEEDYQRVKAAGGATASFLAGQNGLFFDPTVTQTNDEPAFAFISHEGGGWVSVESTLSLDYGQILLRMFSDAMIGSEYIPEIYF